MPTSRVRTCSTTTQKATMILLVQLPPGIPAILPGQLIGPRLRWRSVPVLTNADFHAH